MDGFTRRSAAQLDSTPAEHWVGHTATAHYTPVIIPPLRYPRDLPRLNAEWVRRMLSDSAVQLALAARKAPLLSVEFAYQEQGRWAPGIRASDPAIGQFVHRQLQRLWKRGIARLLDSAQIWGWGAGEVTFRRTRDAQLEVDQILVRDHEDIRPVVQDGAIIGVEFRRLQKTQSNRHGQDKIALAFPRAIWHAHHPQSGQWFGWTVLAAAFSPWWDKHGSGGALDVRRLFMTKDGYRGTRIYYPSGYSTVQQPDGTTKQVPNHEIAMQIVETIRTGGVFALPSEVDANGTPRWKVEESQVSNNPSHILQYPKELDAEILNAMGIADDVLKSEATGSWAGKAVPQQATYCILEQWLSDLICDVDRVVEKLVEINFGPGHQYEITTRPLADQMLSQQNGANIPADGKQAEATPQKSDPAHTSGRRAPPPDDLLRMGRDEEWRDEALGAPWLRMGEHHNLHAPRGGVRINGKFFLGGQFIPNVDLNQASEKELEILDEKLAKNEPLTDIEHRNLTMEKVFNPQRYGLESEPRRVARELREQQWKERSERADKILEDFQGKWKSMIETLEEIDRHQGEKYWSPITEVGSDPTRWFIPALHDTWQKRSDFEWDYKRYSDEYRRVLREFNLTLAGKSPEEIASAHAWATAKDATELFFESSKIIASIGGAAASARNSGPPLHRLDGTYKPGDPAQIQLLRGNLRAESRYRFVRPTRPVIDEPTWSSPQRVELQGHADSMRAIRSRERPNVVSNLLTRRGYNLGRSQKSGQAPEHHPVVAEILKRTPADPKALTQHGRCAEIDSVNNALRAEEAVRGTPITTLEEAKEVLEGAVINTAVVRGPNNRGTLLSPGLHGTSMEPCRVCNPVLRELGVTFE